MDQVKREDFIVLKSLSAPPQLVKEILAAVMTLLGKENARDYMTARKALSNPASFLETLLTFDVDSVTAENAVSARGYINEYSLEKARSVCAASVSMLCWVQDVISKVEAKNGGLSDAPVTTKQT